MFMRTKAPAQCRKYEARLEDYLGGAVDPELEEHLNRCANCRTALEDARMAGNWVRGACEPASEPSGVFLAGVMTRIREEQTQFTGAFWNPLEFLASRLSLTAAMLLLALSVYVAGFTSRHTTTPSAPSQSELNATDFPQPPGDPVSNEEVLLSLAERDYGR
jgi:hypothetical protein